VELLAVQDQVLGRGRRVGPAGKRLDVGHALLLVDDEVEDEVHVLGLGLAAQRRGIEAIVPAVVHVHVHVGVAPAPRPEVVETLEHDLHRRDAALGHVHLAPHRAELEAARHFDREAARRHRDGASAARVEVRVLEGTGRAIEVVVGVHERVVRGEGPSVGRVDGDARRCLPAVRALDQELKPAPRPLVPALGDLHLAARGPRQVDRPERNVAALVGDVHDLAAVGAEARGGGVVLAIGQRERLSSIGGHEPELVPLPAVIGAVDDAPAIPCPVGTGLPRRLLVAQLPLLGSRLRASPPEPPGAPDPAVVADVEELLAVRRPGGREVVVVLAVVVARQPAVLVLADPLRGTGRAAVSERHDEEVKAALVRGRDEGETRAVGREPRLEVHLAAFRERKGLAGLEIEAAQLHRVAVVGREDDEAAVGRPVRLEVVTGAVRELHRRRRSEGDAPERALHREDELAPVTREGRGARPARELGKVHLTVVVAVRDLDLLEHRLAQGGPGGRRRGPGREKEQGHRGTLVRHAVPQVSVRPKPVATARPTAATRAQE
jgi:hypothetical protein